MSRRSDFCRATHMRGRNDAPVGHESRCAVAIECGDAENEQDRFLEQGVHKRRDYLRLMNQPKMLSATGTPTHKAIGK